LRVAETPGVEGETFNLGTGFEVRVGDLAEEIISLIGRPVEIIKDNARLRPEKSEVQRLLSDNSLARQRLGWQPAVSLRHGLKETLAWIEQHLDLYQPDLPGVTRREKV
jgi:dTDP-glucose 4,6-dehydratase